MRKVSPRPSRNLEPNLGARPPEEAIPYLLKSLHHSLRRVVEEGLRRERIDMSVAHLAMLYTLEAEPGLVGAELARRGFVTAQTMNTTLRRMERDGQIERRPHPASQRADSWFVTKKGQGSLDKAKIVGKAIWRNMLSALAAGEVTQLQNLLQRCIGSLDGQTTGSRRSRKTAREPASLVKRSATRGSTRRP